MGLIVEFRIEENSVIVIWDGMEYLVEAVYE